MNTFPHFYLLCTIFTNVYYKTNKSLRVSKESGLQHALMFGPLAIRYLTSDNGLID